MFFYCYFLSRWCKKESRCEFWYEYNYRGKGRNHFRSPLSRSVSPYPGSFTCLFCNGGRGDTEVQAQGVFIRNDLHFHTNVARTRARIIQNKYAILTNIYYASFHTSTSRKLKIVSLSQIMGINTYVCGLKSAIVIFKSWSGSSRIFQ